MAMPRYNQRDDRLASMTDEAVDRYYTCILCQSFAPAHCCVVTPERLGLCGAVSWLDAIADEVTKVHAICVKCGALAYVSHRLVNNERRVLLGEKDEYEPLCRECYQKALKGDN